MVLGLATGKPQCFAENILKLFGIEKYFFVVDGSKEDNSFDKKRDILRKAMETVGAEKTQTVIVGDRKYDIIAAKENGIASVGLTLGFASEDELKNVGATYLVEDFSALTALLARL